MQRNQVVSFFNTPKGDWSQRELAEFYRVEAALANSGISLSTDRGLTDEGDPWFIFSRKDNEEVIVHFARINGEYVIFSNLTNCVVRGRNFIALVRELLDSHPYVLPKANQRRQTVYLHPATLLAALILTAYVKSAEMGSGPNDRDDGNGHGTFFDGHGLLAISALVLSAVWDTLAADPSHNFADVGSFQDASDSRDTGVHTATSHDTILTDLVVRDAVHLGASHFSALSEQPLVHQAPNDAADAASTAQIDVLSYQALAARFHLTDSDPGAALPEISRSDNGGSDAGQNLLAVFKNELEELGATSKTAPGLDHGSRPASTDAHGSSSLTPALGTSISTTVLTALSTVWDDLHVDPQTLHSIVLAANTLPDAVEIALSQLATHLNVIDASTTNFGSAPAVPSAGSVNNDFLSTVQLNNFITDPQHSLQQLLSSAEVHNFGADAQLTLEMFFKETPSYKIESFGPNVLVVDTDASHYSFSHLETWKMTDGSTLSILGQAVHMPTALAA